MMMEKEDFSNTRKLIQDFLTDMFSHFLEQMRAPSYHLQNITSCFHECGVEYCIIGALASDLHNYSRYTDDLDILVTKAGFARISEYLIGCGFAFRPASKQNLYYSTPGELRLPVDVFIEGDMVGDYAMPSPKDVRVRFCGMWYATLPFLIVSKLRAGNGVHKHDVFELIEANKLDKDFALKLEPDVQDKFLKMLNMP
jgi:hypothetical protein